MVANHHVSADTAAMTVRMVQSDEAGQGKLELIVNGPWISYWQEPTSPAPRRVIGPTSLLISSRRIYGSKTFLCFRPEEVLPIATTCASIVSMVQSDAEKAVRLQEADIVCVVSNQGISNQSQVAGTTVIELGTSSQDFVEAIKEVVARFSAFVPWPTTIYVVSDDSLPSRTLTWLERNPDLPIIVGPYAGASQELPLRVMTLIMQNAPWLRELPSARRLASAAAAADWILSANRNVTSILRSRAREDYCRELLATVTEETWSRIDVNNALGAAAVLMRELIDGCRSLDAVRRMLEKSPWPPPFHQSWHVDGPPHEENEPLASSVAPDIEVASDYHGFLEDCGCKSSSAGGFRRLLAHWLSEASTPQVVLGDMVGRPGRPEYSASYSDVIVRSLAKLQQQNDILVVPGENELLYAIRGGNTSGLIFTIANLSRIAGIESEPCRLITIGSQQYVAVGLVSPTVTQLSPRQHEIVAQFLRPIGSFAQVIKSTPANTPVIVMGTLNHDEVAEVKASADGRAVVFLIQKVVGRLSTGRACSGLVEVGASMYGVTDVGISSEVGAQGRMHQLRSNESVPAGYLEEIEKALHEDLGDASEVIFDEPTMSHGARFVGSSVCRSCHFSEHEDWTRTAHYSAFQTLKRVQRQRARSCVPCHVVGYGLDSGYSIDSPREELVGVGCEVCHGPGSEHTSNPRFPMRKTPGPQLCLVCHNIKHSDFANGLEARYFDVIDHR